MSELVCSCEEPTFGNMRRPNCVIEQKALAFPIFIPRFKADGTRNTLDPSSPTIGAQILALINAADPQDRIYPMPRVENATYPRTDTVTEEAASGRKIKIDGVGGVRSWLMELWAKDAVSGMHREIAKFGCSELDVFYIDVAGNFWGIKDDINGTVFRGYEVSEETFDVFKMYATDTTTGKLNVSFDLDNQECEENSYAITADELGYKATTLRGLMTAFLGLTSIVDGAVTMEVYSGYGSAGNRHDIVGIDTIAPPVVISLYNVTQDVSMTDGAALAPTAIPGQYTFTYIAGETAIADVVRVDITGATGYDVTDNTFISV